MVIWVAVGGRGTLIGAVFGAFFVRLFASLVSSAVPGAWLFIQGGLFILVVTVLPQGVVGWINEVGPKTLLIDISLKLDNFEKNFKSIPIPLRIFINFFQIFYQFISFIRFNFGFIIFYSNITIENKSRN